MTLYEYFCRGKTEGDYSPCPGGASHPHGRPDGQADILSEPSNLLRTSNRGTVQWRLSLRWSDPKYQWYSGHRIQLSDWLACVAGDCLRFLGDQRAPRNAGGRAIVESRFQGSQLPAVSRTSLSRVTFLGYLFWLKLGGSLGACPEVRYSRRCLSDRFEL